MEASAKSYIRPLKPRCGGTDLALNKPQEVPRCVGLPCPPGQQDAMGNSRIPVRHIKKNAWSLLVLLAAICGSWACAGKDDASDKADKEGLRLCCELGALCHVPDDGADAEVDECHHLGHENIPEVCRKEYDRCIAACTMASDVAQPGEHGCE